MKTKLYLFLFFVFLAIAGVLVGLILDRLVNNGIFSDLSVASELVWSAEIPKTQEERNKYSEKWRLFITSGNFNFYNAKVFNDEEGYRFEIQRPILEVKNETLYGRDLNYYLLFYNFDKYVSSEPLTDEDVDPIIDMMILDSLILQYANEYFGLNLDELIFNTVDKDITLRNFFIEQYRDKIYALFLENISAEAITVWFEGDFLNNTLTSDVAKNIAFTKIKEVYDKLNANTRNSLEFYVDYLATDSDIINQLNHPVQKLYLKINTTKENISFEDSKITNALFGLGEGDVSHILLGKAKDSSGNLKDSYYIFFKVNSRSMLPKYTNLSQLEKNLPEELKSNLDQYKKLFRL